jgi:Fe2+ or Zn2+ uptake regulation protein
VSRHRSLDDNVEANTGYQVTGHFTVFEGICPACQAKQEAQAS